jgi:hypothetical protein
MVPGGTGNALLRWLLSPGFHVVVDRPRQRRDGVDQPANDLQARGHWFEPSCAHREVFTFGRGHFTYGSEILLKPRAGLAAGR